MRRERRPSAVLPFRRGAVAVTAAALACLAGASGAVASIVVEFPGPIPVDLLSEPFCATTLDIAAAGDFLAAGTAGGDVTLIGYNPSSGVLAAIERVTVGGSVVALLPLRDGAGTVTGLLAATRDPDRIVTLSVAPDEPYLAVTGRFDLEEDPGGLARAAADLAVVTLPGIDRIAWLAPEGGRWRTVGGSDAGDRPRSVVAADLDGDGTAEVAVANEGVLSRSLMVFRRDQGGYGLDQDLTLPGAPAGLAVGDTDGDGRDELAVVSADTALAWLLADAGGTLAETARLALTVAADAVHVARLPGGTWGLYPSSSSRGLLEYFRNDGGAWARRDGYYPGCRPVGALTGDLNGDAVPDLASIGGTSRVVTVMFGSPDLDYWGFPALALPGRPGGLSLGDFDGDGLNDVVVMSADNGTLGFFRGRSDGGVVVSPLVQELFLLPAPMAAVDALPRSGPELAVHDRLGGAVHLLAYGDGGFAVAESTPLAADVRRLAAGDVDGDGHQDLVALTGAAPEVRVLFGAGDGTFPAAATFGFQNLATGVVAVDLDADGRLDLVGVDAINRVWTARNVDGRSFTAGTWLNAGSGSRDLSLGDLDGDGDLDVVVTGLTDETLTFLENTGTGDLSRRVGSLALDRRPVGSLVEDVNQDGTNDIVVNLREAGVIAVVYGLPGWFFTPPVDFAAGGDVAYFATDDFNSDLVPDILTLDESLRLGLTMLNVERGLVPAAPPALAAACADGLLEVTVRPAAPGPWRLDLAAGGRVRTLASDAGAREGRLAAAGAAWTWRGEGPGAGPAELRLWTGSEPRVEVLDLAAGGCGDQAAAPLAWTREPWPNPFNPAVAARIVLLRPAPVTAAVYDLRGRLVAVLVRADLPAGEHELRWDGRRGGRPAEAGVYLLRVQTPERVLTGKLLLMK